VPLKSKLLRWGLLCLLFIVVEGVEHNPFIMYEEIGEKLVRFHAKD
jgi:hypothetical protein